MTRRALISVTMAAALASAGPACGGEDSPPAESTPQAAPAVESAPAGTLRGESERERKRIAAKAKKSKKTKKTTQATRPPVAAAEGAPAATAVASPRRKAPSNAPSSTTRGSTPSIDQKQPEAVSAD